MASLARFSSDRPVRRSTFDEEERQQKAESGLSEAGKKITFASWDKAVSQLKEELKRSDSKKTSRTLESIPHADFTDVVDAAKTAAERTAAKRFRSTETIQRVLENVNKYAIVGDLIVQHHAEYTSLVWGAFRFILLAAVEEGKIEANLSASLDEILQVLLRTQEYSTLFSHYSGYENFDLFQGLQDNITQLYERVLKFLVRTVKFFEERTIKRYAHSIVSPFDTKFKPLMDDIKSLEINIEKAVVALERVHNMRRENFAWLSTTDYSSDIDKINSECLDGTCEWFFDLEEYQRWNEDANGSNLLWIQGKPGCGKSTIAAQLVTRLEHQPAHLVVSVFCKEKDQMKGKLESILCGIISQILAQAKSSMSLHSLVQSYRVGANTVHPNQTLLWALLRDILSTFHGLQCIVDGLDECEASERDRLEFLKNFGDLFQPRDTSARPHKAVILSRVDSARAEVSEVWTCANITDSNTRDDIRRFVEHALDSSKKLSKHLKRREVFQYLTENASGMILWAKLMLAELEIGYRNIDRVLSRVPKGLTEVYTSILTRFSRSETLAQWDRVLAMLSIVSVASKPLTLREFAVALAFWDWSPAKHEDPPNELGAYELDEITEAISMTAPLLLITPATTVEMAHTSLTQFLLSTGQNLVSQMGNFQDKVKLDEGSLHYQMTSMICRYLNSKSLHDALDSGEKNSAIRQLLEYACSQLVYHATRGTPLADSMSIIMKFFDSENAWRWLHALKVRFNLEDPEVQIIQSHFRKALAAIMETPNSSPQYNLLIFITRRRYEQLLSKPPDNELRLSSARNLAGMLDLEGYWDEAARLEREVLEIREKGLGPEHHYVLLGMGNLASMYSSQGRWSEAEKLASRQVDIVSKLYPPEHRRVLTCKNNLAIYKEQLLKLDEAQALEEEVLETRRKHFGSDDSDTISSINNLRVLYWNQGKPKESERLDAEIKALLDKDPSLLDRPENLTMIGNMATHYSKSGDYREAEKLAKRAVETAQNILGPDHPETLLKQDQLAIIYGDQRQHAKSEQLHTYVANARRRILGPEHFSTLDSLHNLAISLKQLEKYDKAKKLLEELVETKRKVFGETQRSTLASETSLAALYHEQGRYKDAEDLLIDIRKTQKELLSDEHPDVVESGAMLSLVLSDMAKYDEAIELQRQIIEIHTKNYGEQSPRLWNLKHNLSVYLYNSGRLEESIRIDKSVLKARSSKLGSDHQDVLSSKQSMMKTYELEGNLAEAEKLGVENLEICRRKFGNVYSTTLQYVRSLANIYRLQGRLDLAETLGKEVLNAREQTLGVAHPVTVTCMVELANYYRRQGRYEEALKLGERALELRRQSDGPEHPFYFTHLVHQGRTLRYMGRLEEAEKFAIQGVDGHKRFFKVDSNDTSELDVLRAMSGLASVYQGQSRFKEAEELRTKILEGKKLALGDKHWETFMAMSRLAASYSKDHQKLHDAEKLAMDAAAMQEEKLGAKHPARFFSLSVLASIRLEQGKIQDAITLQRQAFEGRKEVLGPLHPETAQSLSILTAYEAQQAQKSSE